MTLGFFSSDFVTFPFNGRYLELVSQTTFETECVFQFANLSEAEAFKP